MALIEYTLRNVSSELIFIGKAGSLAPNSQSSFRVEDDSDEETAINSLIQRGKFTLVSSQEVRSPYTPTVYSSPVTLAQLALIAPTFGAVYSVSDMGGATYRGDGTKWVPTATPRFYLPAVFDVTRNSLNDATDDDEVVMGTFTIKAGTLSPGSMFEFISLWENSNSANTKALTMRANGNSLGTQNQTTNQSVGLRYNVHVQSLTQLVMLNSATANGAGSASGVVYSVTVADLSLNDLVLTLTSKWTTQPINGEFIRLKLGKVIWTV